MLRVLTAALFMTIAATAPAGAMGARTITGTCAPRDATSDRLIATFKSIVTRATLAGTVIRSTLGLTDVTPSQILPVTDKTTCTKAADAMYAQVPAKHTSYTLYVVTLGTSYGVLDNTITEPGKSLAYVFDRNWKYIGNQAL